MITIDDFRKLEMRVATVLEATDHPNADRLILLRVDVGEDEPRQIVAGIKTSYAPEALIGKQVVILTNLEPAVLRGMESNGMLLATGSGDEIRLLTPNAPVPPGSQIS